MSEPGQQLIELMRRQLGEIQEGIATELPDLPCDVIGLEGKLHVLGILTADLMDEVVAEFGLSPVEQQVLGILRGKEADAPSALARATQQSAAGMTRTLDRMEERGLVQRRSDGKDRRRLSIHLTRKGKALADRKLRAEIGAWGAALEGLGDRRLARTHEVLDDLIVRLADARARARS